MSWFTDNLGASVGKKLMMAITGLGFSGFLAAHLAGNLTLYIGPAAFNSYADHHHALGPLVTVAELGLLLFAIVHVLTGAVLFYENFRARPVRYAVSARAGGRTLGSGTMPYTGILLLLFVIFHLFNFHFVDKTHTTIYAIVAEAFGNPGYVFLYIVAMVIAAIHVSHGFWSAFQTLGLNHPKYMPLITTLGVIFSLAIGIGFGFIPIFISISA